MSELESPVSVQADLQAAEHLSLEREEETDTLHSPLSLDKQKTIDSSLAPKATEEEEKPAQQDFLETLLSQPKEEYRSALEVTKELLEKKASSEEMKNYRSLVEGYCKTTTERLNGLEKLFAESREGLLSQIDEERRAGEIKEVNRLKREMSDASYTLRDLYRRHTLNLHLLHMPLRASAGQVREELLAHFDALLFSDVADVQLKSESVGFALEDELARAATVEAVLTGSGIEEDQELSDNLPTLLRDGIPALMHEEMKSEKLDNTIEGQDIVTLPAFLKSEGKESPGTEDAIYRYKAAHMGFRCFRAGKRLIDENEREYKESYEAADQAFHTLEALRQDGEANADDLREASLDFEKKRDTYFLNRRIRNRYSAARRGWVAKGDELGTLLNRTLTRAFAKAEEEFNGEQDAEKKGQFREDCFQKLSEIAWKVDNVGRLFTCVVFDSGLKKQQEPAFDRLFGQAMTRLQKTAETLEPKGTEDFAALLSLAERLVKAAGETMQLLKREKDKKTAEREEEPEAEVPEELDEEEEEGEEEEEDEEEEEEEEPLSEEKEYDFDGTLDAAVNEVFDVSKAEAQTRAALEKEKAAERTAQAKEKARRELAAAEKELKERKEKLERDQAAYETRVVFSSASNQKLLKLPLTNRFAKGQEVLVPKEPLGKISDFTDAAGNKVEGVGKMRVFSEKFFRLKAPKLEERIGKHVDRFLGSNGEITDEMLSNTAFRVVESVGLDPYAHDPKINLFGLLAEAKDEKQISHAVEEVKKAKLFGVTPSEELEIDDPFYRSFPNAQKTVLLYRIANHLCSLSAGSFTDDYTIRMLAARNNLKKLRDQILASPEYVRCKTEADKLKGDRDGYQNDLTKVQKRMADIRSTLGELPPLEEYTEALKKRNSAAEKRLGAAKRSAGIVADFHEYHMQQLAAEKQKSEEERKKKLEGCIADIRLSRENDRTERRERLERMRAEQKGKLPKSTLHVYLHTLKREIFEHEAFAKGNPMYSAFRKKGDPEVKELLKQNRKLLSVLIQKQITTDQPGGVQKLQEITRLSRQELSDYAAIIRSRLLNLQAVYTKEHLEWFANKRFTERLLGRMVSGNEKDVNQLLQDANSLYMDSLERDRVMRIRDSVMLEGQCWDNMHFFVNLYDQQKSTLHDSIRSSARMNRMMDADDFVESVCRACSVEKPLSYYEYMADYFSKNPEKEKTLELSKKKDLYGEYLKTWAKQAGETMAKRKEKETGKDPAEEGEKAFREAGERLKQIDSRIEELKKELEESRKAHKETEENDPKKELGEASLHLREAELEYEQILALRERTAQRKAALEAAPEGETEKEALQHKRTLQKETAELERLQARSEELLAKKEERVRDLEELEKAWEENRKKGLRLTERIGELEKELLEQEAKRDEAEDAFIVKQQAARKLAKAKTEKEKKPEDVVEFLTRKEKQHAGSLSTSRSNMLEYGVYAYGSRLMQGELGSNIHSEERKTYNKTLERNALFFFRCSKLTRDAIAALPEAFLKTTDQKLLLQNLESNIMRFDSLESYETALKAELTRLQGEDRSEILRLSERKDKRLMLFRRPENLPFLPLVPLLLKDEKCVDHILSDTDENYREFLAELKKRSTPYMNLLGMTGVYNGLIDQYLLDYGKEILEVINGEREAPERRELLNRFADTYKDVIEQDVTDTTIKDILKKGLEEVEKDVAKKEVSKEPGIPSLDKMTLYTMVMLTGGTEALRDQTRLANYQERAKENAETLRAALGRYLETEPLEGKEKESFLAGVEMMERTCLMQDPEEYSRTVLPRLRKYRSYQREDFRYAKGLKEIHQEIDRCMNDVRVKKEEGRKKLMRLRSHNFLMTKKLEGPELSEEEAAEVERKRKELKLKKEQNRELLLASREEDLAKKAKKIREVNAKYDALFKTQKSEPYVRMTEYTEESRLLMKRIVDLHSMLPSHGGLNTFYQEIIARASIHAAENPETAKELMTEDYYVLVNMLNTDAAVTEFAAELTAKDQLHGNTEEEMLRTGIFELLADFATSTEIVYEKKRLLGLMRMFFTEEKGGSERLKVVLHDKGLFYGLGNTLGNEGSSFLCQQKRKYENQTDRAGFERFLKKRKKGSGAVRLYFQMPEEEKALTAQMIVNQGVTIPEARTLPQRIYTETMAQIRHSKNEDRDSSALIGMVEGYLSGFGSVMQPDFTVVMGVLNRTVGPDMESFEKAVRLVQQLKSLKEAALIPTPAELGKLLSI